LTGEPVNTPY